MEFDIEQDGESLNISVETMSGGFNFIHGFSTRNVAGWICDAIREGMEERIQQIRREAYLQGRRSAHNKDLKCTEFNGCINSNEVGW